MSNNGGGLRDSFFFVFSWSHATC